MTTAIGNDYTVEEMDCLNMLVLAELVEGRCGCGYSDLLTLRDKIERNLALSKNPVLVSQVD